MRKWTLLHLISSDRWTGAAEPVTNLVRGLRTRGHNVHLGVIRGRSFESHLQELGISPVAGLTLSRRFSPLSTLRDMRFLSRFIHQHRVDLVHCHMNHDHWLAAATKQIARLHVPLVRTEHRLRGQRHAEWGARLLTHRLTDATVVLSGRHLLEDPVIRTVPEERVHVIPGAVDTDLFHPSCSGLPVREALGIPGTSPVIGMIAHFKAGRGWRTAVPAFAQVAGQRADAHFILAGGHSRLVKWIRATLGEAQCLQRTHIITDRRFAWPEVLAAMDFSVWLAPGSEASARAVMEVMASGKPVIAGDYGVISDLIQDGINGHVVPVGVTGGQLSEVIMRLVNDPDRRRVMGGAARQTIERGFTVDRQLDATEQLYRSLIETSP